MTRTDTAKNRRWSWLVILVVISLAIAAVFWAVERVGDTDEDAAAVRVPADNDGADSETSSPLQDYLQFAGAAGDRQMRDSDADPDNIVEGLRKLAGALGTLNLGSPDLQVDLRVAAEHLLLNSTSTATTAVVRNSLISAADAIEAERPNEVNLRRLAESVRRDRPLLDQRAAVREFFRESATAMQRLSPQTDAGSRAAPRHSVAAHTNFYLASGVILKSNKSPEYRG